MDKEPKQRSLAHEVAETLKLPQLWRLLRLLRDAISNALQQPIAEVHIIRTKTATPEEKAQKQQAYLEALNAILKHYEERLKAVIPAGEENRLNIADAFNMGLNYVDVNIRHSKAGQLTAGISIADFDHTGNRILSAHELEDCLKKSIPEILAIVENQLQSALASKR